MHASIFRFIVSLAFALLITTPLATAQNSAVKMPAFKVNAAKDWIEFVIRTDDETGAVQEARVSFVSAWYHEKGLRIGDVLASIDGKPVAGVLPSDLDAAMKRELKKGEARTMMFTGRRLLIRPVKITMTTHG